MRAEDAIKLLKEQIEAGHVNADTQIQIIFLNEFSSLDMLEHSMDMLKEFDPDPKHIEALARIYDAIDEDILYDTVQTYGNQFEFIEDDGDYDQEENSQEDDPEDENES